MKTTRILLLIAWAALLLNAATNRSIQAQDTSTSGYDLAWWSLDEGGEIAPAGAGYAVSGTIAQPDARTWQGAHYALRGGFWQEGILELLKKLFLPLVTR